MPQPVVEPSPPAFEVALLGARRRAGGVVFRGVGENFELLQRREHVLFLFLLGFQVKRATNARTLCRRQSSIGWNKCDTALSAPAA